jgi:NAD(P)-dependent dehydrogenase (short-subunit alcohol dehydrogenase family)
VWSVNVLGTRRLIEAAAPTLIGNGRDAQSRIVAVASSAGSTGLYHLAAYSAAKHAVVGLIRGVAMDLAQFGVTANAVSPGSTRTAMLTASARVYDLASEEEFAKSQPIGRLIEPHEVAASIVWLCSPAASAITGADIAVDGGMTVS